VQRRHFNLSLPSLPAAALAGVGARAAAQRQGGILRACASYEPGSLDIHKLQSGNLLWQGRWLFDGLIYLDGAGKPSPWLAKSWTVSPDGTVYRFNLREDVTFSDGTSFDAEAVRINFERIRTLGGQSRISSAYLGPYRDTVVRGHFVADVRFTAPIPGFLWFLAQVWLSSIGPRQIREAPETIAPRAILRTHSFWPTIALAARAQFRCRLDYRWAPAALGHRGAALLDGIALKAVPEAADRTAALRAGAYHIDLEADLRSAGQLAAKSDYLGSNTLGNDRTGRIDARFRSARSRADTRPSGWSLRDADGIRIRAGRRLSAELVSTGGERTPPRTVAAMRDNPRDFGLELLPRGGELGGIRQSGRAQGL